MPASRVNAQTDRDHTLVAAYHAARMAERAVNRYNSVDDGDEVDLLKEQLENIDESEDDGNSNETDTTNERDIIKCRFCTCLFCRSLSNTAQALTQHTHLRFEAITLDHNACAVQKADKQAKQTREHQKFTCAVCLDECVVRAPSGLRILAPCGHGFCARCIEAHKAVQGPSIACPTCRAPVSSVVTPFF
jgi:hypothetical protein